MKGILVFIGMVSLFIPLTIINLALVIQKHRTWKSVDTYFYYNALDFDHFANHNFKTVFNKFLVKKGCHQFGDFRETVSSVLGKNQKTNTLTKSGRWLANTLDYFDPDHCQNSINNF